MKRAIVAIPFLAALLLAARLNTGPVLATADATRPGFSLRDETVNAGLGFVHQRPTLDRRIANV